MFLILGALRGFNTSMLACREGKWRGHPPPPLGHDPQDKTLGVLGMGGIGRNMKKKAEMFGMSTIVSFLVGFYLVRVWGCRLMWRVAS